MQRSLAIVNECLAGRISSATQKPRSVYRHLDARYGMTLRLIAGKNVVYEGVPGVGKTTLMWSTHEAIKALGGASRAHEERPDREMLAQFFQNPKGNAFWFQMHKLHNRQKFAMDLESHARRASSDDATPETELVDRSLPGDLAFAIYNHMVGNISDEQFRIYVSVLLERSFTAPFLVIYMTADPQCLVDRVAARGNADEIAFYTVDYYRAMDPCYRAALELTGCHYCVVDWGKDLPGVMGAGPWSPERGRVSAEKCMEVIEAAIAATYGSNIERINAKRSADGVKLSIEVPDGSVQFVPNDTRKLDASDPDDLVRDTKELVLKYSGQFKDTSEADVDEAWEAVY